MSDLGTYDGRDVLQVRAKVTKVGDGLSEALGIEPVVHHMGDEVYLVVKTIVGKHTHEPIASTDALALVLTFKGETITVVEPALVKEVIERQEELNREARARAERAKREAKGEFSFDAELDAAHSRGEHADGRVDECAQCELEGALDKAGV